VASTLGCYEIGLEEDCGVLKLVSRHPSWIQLWIRPRGRMQRHPPLHPPILGWVHRWMLGGIRPGIHLPGGRWMMGGIHPCIHSSWGGCKGGCWVASSLGCYEMGLEGNRGVLKLVCGCKGGCWVASTLGCYEMGLEGNRRVLKLVSRHPSWIQLRIHPRGRMQRWMTGGIHPCIHPS